MSLLIEMMFTFMKIGAFSFGGGYAMIPLFQKELVGHGWMLISEVADVVAISEMTPGPFAVNAATFAGTKMTVSYTHLHLRSFSGYGNM